MFRSRFECLDPSWWFNSVGLLDLGGRILFLSFVLSLFRFDIFFQVGKSKLGSELSGNLNNWMRSLPSVRLKGHTKSDYFSDQILVV